MQKALLRQLRRAFGVADEASLAALLARAQSEDDAQPLPDAIRGLLLGLEDFLARVDASYSQYERDLELRTRSLGLSSAELSAANTRLRNELNNRESALATLRQTIRELLPTDCTDPGLAHDDDLKALSQQVARLVEERELSRRLLDNQKFALDQHAIVSITDPDGNITYANDRFCEISGYAQAELLGKNHRLISSGFHPPEFFANLWDTIADGRVWHGELCNRAKAGHLYWVSATVVPLLDEAGRPEQYIAIRTDITDRKAAEAELQRAKETAEQANRAKSEFLANMSHEIRTPMNGVIGMTDLALDTKLTEEQREYLSIAKSSAESLLTVLNDILDFSKIEAGKLSFERIPFNLHRVIGETLKTLSQRAHEKGLELISDIDPHVPVHTLGDPGRLRQVLVNLIGNAIKFTEGGEIVLGVAVEQASAELTRLHFSVRDTGIGIAPEKQAQIFESFAQEDNSTTRKYGGSGLGLSICSRLVELMDGRIWVESCPGLGSTFHFTAAFDLDLHPQTTQPHAVSLAGKCVLIVDDNATNRRVLSGMLTQWEVSCQAVDSGAAALQSLMQPAACFDCILLDFQMPGMDGFELAQRIRQLPAWRSTPLIMLSSGIMQGDLRRCQETGIAGYFAKPIASEDLSHGLMRTFGLAAMPITGSASPAPVVTRDSVFENGRPLQVLLVDDHKVNQKLAVSLLEKWGHQPTVAHNGREALDRLIAGEFFDLVLMDMQMPVMGGIEATQLIRQREAAEQLPRLPIIAMTANAMLGDKEICLGAGMDDYLAKPIKAKELLEKLLTFGNSDAPPVTAAGFDYAQALHAADRATVDIIAGVFLATWPQELEHLRDAVARDDLQTAERISHTLKGTLTSFNAQPAARLAADLEMRARHGRISRLGEEIDTLQREIEALTNALVEFGPA